MTDLQRLLVLLRKLGTKHCWFDMDWYMTAVTAISAVEEADFIERTKNLPPDEGSW